MSQPKTGPAETSADSSSLAKAYEPKNVESHWYDVWEKAGYFKPSGKGQPYVIVIPPPNVTGSLHMGHALNQTLQDVIIRHRRMMGDAALWVPGTDHGGIATQNVVEKMLMKEGMSRHDLGREKFLERMWKWREQTGDTILMQSKRLGSSFDHSRTRFTMDEQCSRAVRHAFVELYNRKLLYRGKRLVNWCPRCATALADIEVEHRDAKGHLWHIRYPIVERRRTKRAGAKKGSDIFDRGYVVVATTRPETLLGDTAVAVNPKDKRYKELVGVKLKLPLTGREIPVVADDAIDKTFGSGAVKVTPAHDPTDFEIAERQKLPHITVIGFDGKMTADAGDAYKGLDRFAARKQVVADLEAQGLLDKVEDYTVSLSVCYRCDDVIEPLESEQWFLSMAEMAKMGRDANKKGKVRIVPESWEGPYQLWLRNLRDWCVSRQIWWGHRIPVWYCVNSENGGAPQRTSHPPMVAMEAPSACANCGNQQLEQDPDVLDTWFSSALWPMSVFGWPDKTPDLERFYPTTTLVTGHEILYLWVARMIMFGLEFLGKVPYKWVLIHGIVRDKAGRKMSKSLGNVIDPLELIEEFGADAVRFSLAQSAAPGRDMQISKDNFIGARNFCNKVWNATRFALMNLSGLKSVPPIPKNDLDVADKWILHRFNETVKETSAALDRFDLDAASRGLYNFFWSELCDWYLELIKPRVDREHYADIPVTRASTDAARAVLATVLEGSVKLLHPFMPFLTEELWSKIPKSTTTPHVIVADWPSARAEFSFPDAAREIAALQEIATKLRAIRSEMNIPPSQPITVVARASSQDAEKLLSAHTVALRCLNTRVAELKVGKDGERPAASAAAVVPGADLWVPLEGLIDFGKEKARLEKELAALRQDSDRLNKKLSNHDFVTNAPKEEVDRVRARFEESKERIHHLEENIATLTR